MATRTFNATVEGIGEFVFRQRTPALGIRVESEVAKILGGDGETNHPGVEYAARQLAEVTILTASGPPGWNIDDLDPLDSDDYKQLRSVWEAYRVADKIFRDGLKAERAAARTGTG